MIADQKIGKSFMGALTYNLKKMNNPDLDKRAELLETNFTSLDVERIRKEVDLLRQLRPGLNRYVYHTSLNFALEDELNNTQLREIAQQYLEANGFVNNQYLIFRHRDAGHMHLHLLANRITFDGMVVSDSNNYKKSEAILRNIEKQYGLASVLSSNEVVQRAAKNDELEMIIRTGRPSDKLVLQELLKRVLTEENLTVPALIMKGEQAGVHFLFNQASTDRVSGITYFYNGFKIKGQALGNSFKWAEIIKRVNYEQTRDSQAISEANDRTRQRYGEITTTNRDGSDRLYPGSAEGVGPVSGQSENFDKVRGKDNADREESLEAGQVGHDLVDGSTLALYNHFSMDIGIRISDDVDDEAIHGRKRRRNDKSRTNTR